MLTFSQSIRAWIEFQRCTNAVLTIAGTQPSGDLPGMGCRERESGVMRP